jgi:hypothetical protein
MDDLRADLKANIAEASKLELSQLPRHLRDTLWPFLESLVENFEEVDDAVAELVDQSEDYLQQETAAVFAAAIESGLQLASELRARAGGDELLLKKIAQHEQLAKAALEVLTQATMLSPEDADEAEAEGEEDDDA